MAFQFGAPNYGYNPQQTYFPQQMPQQMPQQSGVMCRPVSSIEEARNIQVQFDGSLYAFINVGAGEIYTKQFNFNTGNTDFEVYKKGQPTAPVEYATLEDIKALREEMATLRKKKKAEVIEIDE